jgi:hypothetical protein
MALLAWLFFLLSNLVSVSKSSVESSCDCNLHNMSLILKDNNLQFVDFINTENNNPLNINQKHLVNVTRCWGSCDHGLSGVSNNNINNYNNGNYNNNTLVCRPSTTALKIVAVPVPWNHLNEQQPRLVVDNK